MPLNLTHVLAFHAVAETGSFTAAARREAVSQPTLSAHVRALEAAMGRKLFARAGRGVRLTAAGEALHGATRELARAVARVDEQISGAGAEARRVFRVSADNAIHVLPVLAELKRRRPELTFAIQIANSAEVVASVLADEADVGVTARAIGDQRLLSQQLRLRDDRLVIVLPADDPLAGEEPIRLAKLAGRALALRERGSVTRATTERALAAANVSLDGALEVETREAVLEAVASGFGAALVFASEAGTDPRLARLAIADAGVDVAEYVICRTDRADARMVRDFLAAAEHVAAARGWLKPEPP